MLTLYKILLNILKFAMYGSPNVETYIVISYCIFKYIIY